MKAQSKTERKRMATRRKLVGAKGVDKQRVRRAKSEIKAVAKGAIKGNVRTELNKANTREAVKRVGEYKAGARKLSIKPKIKERKFKVKVKIGRKLTNGGSFKWVVKAKLKDI